MINKKQLLALCTLLCLSASTVSALAIKGGGSTLASPLMDALTSTYPAGDVTYKRMGSYSGASAFMKKEVDFAVSDIPLEKLDVDEKSIIQVPLTVGATAIIYNIKGITSLKLTPDLLVEIFKGRIVRWNDPKIADVNSHLTLPNLPITVVYRGDKSGTTHILTTYFSNTNKKWRKQHGETHSFPKVKNGRPQTGSTRLSQTVANTEGAIGYVDWQYAKQFKLHAAAIENDHGLYVHPNLDSIELSVKDSDSTAIHSDSPYAYPICGFVWIFVHHHTETYTNYNRAKALVKFLKWSLGEGQLVASSMEYPSLPKDMMADIHNKLRSIVFEGIILY